MDSFKLIFFAGCKCTIQCILIVICSPTITSRLSFERKISEGRTSLLTFSVLMLHGKSQKPNLKEY